MVASAAPLPGADDDSAKRRQIVKGARTVFLEHGFDGASMGEIARAAGVSKGTLYVYFADKTSLFVEIMEQESLAQGMSAFEFDPAFDVESSLKVFGAAYIKLLCDPRGASAIRTVMAIAERMPEVGRQYYERVIANSLGKFTRYLEQQVQAGTLQIDNCHLAAAQFTKLCQATLFLPFVFQMTDAPSPERIAEVVDSATRLFLATYGAKRPTG